MLILTYKCSSHASSRQFLLLTETIRDSHIISKYRVMEASPNQYIYETTPVLQAQGLLQRSRKRSQEPEQNKLAVTFDILEVLETTHEIIHHGCLNMTQKRINNTGHDRTEETHKGSVTKKYRQIGNTESRRNNLPQERIPHQFLI